MSPDPANVTSTQAPAMIRGVKGSLGTMTVVGIPIYDGNPVGPRPYIIYLENLKSMAVYKGAIPFELGTGVGSRGGSLNLKAKRAEEKTAVLFKQSLGSYDHARTFIRLDLGTLSPFDSRLSLSCSYTEGDEWRGEGKVGPRINPNFTLVQPFLEKFNFKLWSNYNAITHHAYRSHPYDQAMDTENFYRWDWDESFKGNPNKDWEYYKFNKLSWTYRDLYGFFEAEPSEHFKLELKPHFREEEKEEWTSSQKVSGPKGQSRPCVQLSSWIAKRSGAIAQAVSEYKGLKGALGCYHQASEFLISQSKNFWLNPDGSFSFVGWGRFTESAGRTVTKSPYLGVPGAFGRFRWQIWFEVAWRCTNRKVKGT